MNHHLRRLAPVLPPLVVVAFVLGNIGAYPQIRESLLFASLATFVALNTIGFAVLAAVKMGYQSGRRAARGRATGTATAAAPATAGPGVLGP